MVFLRRTMLPLYLLLSAMLALLLFLSSLWLPQGGVRDCGTVWQPCLSLYRQTPLFARMDWAEPDGAPPLPQECPGQSFQARRLLQYLKASLADAEDVLLEPYLQSWDQLLRFMESLGTMVGFFSQKVKAKITLIQELSLKHDAEAHGKRGPPHHITQLQPYVVNTGVYRSVRSMVEAELNAGVVDFTRRTQSGCRTLLRLHRSLLWLKLMLEGLAEEPDKTPGELSRDAYMVALAPHHSWVLRQAAEFLFLALPDRQFFLELVCAQTQQQATPVLHAIIHALTLVHVQTQRILVEHGMLDLP